MKFTMLVTPFVFLTTVVNGAVVSRTDGPQCNSGTVQCCNTVGDAHSDAVQSLLGGLLGPIGALLPITGTVGVACLPITALGLGGNSCTAQVACCSNVQQYGLINVGCSPVNIL